MSIDQPERHKGSIDERERKQRLVRLGKKLLDYTPEQIEQAIAITAKLLTIKARKEAAQKAIQAKERP